MTILAIDTSNDPLGVALVTDNKVVGEMMTNLKRNHSIRAMPAIEQLMKSCHITPQELTRIVVAEGPGSYTGVRIGVTIAKTLAWSLKIPLVGVSSLEVLAASAGRYFPGHISPIIDARRGQVYTGLYKSFAGDFKGEIPGQHILLSAWLDELMKVEEQILFVGNDVRLHEDVIKEKLGDRATFASFTEDNPRPSELALLGARKSPEEIHGFSPNYLRLAEAEAKWLIENKVK